MKSGSFWGYWMCTILRFDVSPCAIVIRDGETPNQRANCLTSN